MYYQTNMYCMLEMYYQINICIIVRRKYIFRQVCVKLYERNVLSDICLYVELFAGNILPVTCVDNCMQEIYYKIKIHTIFFF